MVSTIREIQKHTGRLEERSISSCQHLASRGKRHSCICWEQDHSKNNVSKVQRRVLTVRCRLLYNYTGEGKGSGSAGRRVAFPAKTGANWQKTLLRKMDLMLSQTSSQDDLYNYYFDTPRSPFALNGKIRYIK